ncbi:MAG: branched-chain amino acid ABC transporter permease [Rhodobacteraceae bacterium]|nr:branched-chain amino acid ABC transporter permease [Paracoccaceae bacterium]
MIKERHLNMALIVVCVVIPVWAHLADEPFIITLMTRAAIFALAAVGLNIALGLGGLVSLGHAAFFGLGGYAMGISAFHAQTFTPVAEWPFLIEGTKSMPAIWLISVAVSAFAATIVGILSLRTSGVYFIMITLAFGQMFFYFSISWPTYGGEDGLSVYVRNGFPGLNTLDPIQFFMICFAILVAALALASRLARSPFGLALNAARQAPQRVETVGLDPNRLKLVAFVISGAMTGLAGALFADLNRFVSPAMFSWQLSGEIMVFVIIGGVGRLFGPVAGALVFVTLEHLLGGFSEFWHVHLGVLLLLVVLFGRGGLIGMICGREGSHD